jgi:hypothetical protein
LSRRDWIMQMAVEEALLLKVPVVTNFSPVLQSVLGDGAAFTALNGASLSRAMREVWDHHDQYKVAIELAATALRSRVDARLKSVEPLLKA